MLVFKYHLDSEAKLTYEKIALLNVGIRHTRVPQFQFHFIYSLIQVVHEVQYNSLT
jgi:hypothetical protein